MWISSASIRNPTTTVVIILALLVFGTIALLRLETDEFPAIQPPVIEVSILFPGASPAVVERELIDPLEESLGAISGLERISSTAMDGVAQIVLTFAFTKDLQQASQDIRDRIAENRRKLPAEIEEPVLSRIDPRDGPIISLALSGSSMPLAELTRLADPEIVGRLRSIAGVASVDISGGVQRELTVELQPRALAAAGVGVPDVVRSIEAQNLAAPLGRIEDPMVEHTIRLRGRLETPDQFARVPVGGTKGRVVTLGEVAKVTDGAAEPRSLAFFDGAPAIGIDVRKARGYSTTRVSDDVRARVEAIARELPPGVQLRLVRDSGARVAQSVHDVQSSLIEGALLTVLVVFVFLLSWRSTLITGLALPVSVLAAFIAVWALGFTLNTMSLLGLSLAIGLLVDDAIVVRENIVRHMEMGKGHLEAAREGTAEIGRAVAATTFSIVVVFVPVAFMGGLAQQWFAPFALTIAASVMVSLFVSFSLDPMLSAVWPDPEVEGGGKTWLTRKLQPFDAWFDRQTARYERVIGWAVRHPAAVAALTLGSFATALAMPAVGLVGSGFLPQQDMSQFGLHLETAPGSSLAYTQLKTREALRILSKRPEVEYTYATVGGAAGDEAYVYVRLVPRAQRSASQAQVAAALRASLDGITGAKVSFGGGPDEKEIQISILGPELSVLTDLADRLSRDLARVPGAVDVGLSSRGQRPEFEVDVDRELAANLGITVGQVAQALRTAFAGVDAGDWVDPTGRTRDVMVRLGREARSSAADLETLPLVVPQGSGAGVPLPLGQVARIRPSLGPAQIWHIGQERVITIGANTDGRPLSEVMRGIDEQLARARLPRGYRLSMGGDVEDQHDVFGRMLGALAVAVLLMYMILVIQFRSFLDPIPIMASLPLSLVGVMLALLATGSTLNLMSLIGVILLMGIVAKNAILLIDFAKNLVEAGHDRRAAIVAAGRVRLRPILMTSVAVIAGMLPVAIGAGEGGDFRAPLGRAVIGGVITSTLLTLLAIPTFYCALADWQTKLLARLTGKSRPDGVTTWPDRGPELEGAEEGPA